MEAGAIGAGTEGAGSISVGAWVEGVEAEAGGKAGVSVKAGVEGFGAGGENVGIGAEGVGTGAK